MSMKAAIKKWGQEAEYAIAKDMKYLHWGNSYKPRHLHGLPKKQKSRSSNPTSLLNSRGMD
jgi:hypothetical protein